MENLTTSMNMSTPATLTLQTQTSQYLSPEFQKDFSHIIKTFVSPVTCLLGLIGNGFGLSVLWRDGQHKQQSSYTYIFVLMSLDTVLLLTGLIQGVFYIAQQFSLMNLNIVSTHVSLYTILVDFMMFHSASVLLIVMSLERFKAIAWPLRSRSSVLSNYPKTTCILICLVCVALNIPYCFSFTVSRRINLDNTTSYAIGVNPKMALFLEDFLFVETLLSFAYPLVLLLLTVAIPTIYSRRMKYRKRKLPNASPHSNRQVKVTVMVLWISGMYIAHSWPKWLHQILTSVDKDYSPRGANRVLFSYIILLRDFLQRVNAANDFCIYFLVSDRYRYIFCKYCLHDQEASFTRDNTRKGNSTTDHSVLQSKSSGNIAHS